MVDDEKMLLEVSREMLELLGYLVYAVGRRSLFTGETNPKLK